MKGRATLDAGRRKSKTETPFATQSHTVFCRRLSLMSEWFVESGEGKTTVRRWLLHHSPLKRGSYSSRSRLAVSLAAGQTYLVGRKSPKAISAVAPIVCRQTPTAGSRKGFCRRLSLLSEWFVESGEGKTTVRRWLLPSSPLKRGSYSSKCRRAMANFWPRAALVGRKSPQAISAVAPIVCRQTPTARALQSFLQETQLAVGATAPTGNPSEI